MPVLITLPSSRLPSRQSTWRATRYRKKTQRSGGHPDLNDIPRWAYRVAEEMVEEGLISGEGT